MGTLDTVRFYDGLITRVRLGGTPVDPLLLPVTNETQAVSYDVRAYSTPDSIVLEDMVPCRDSVAIRSASPGDPVKIRHLDGAWRIYLYNDCERPVDEECQA